MVFNFFQSKTVCEHPDPYLVLNSNPFLVKKETQFLGILLVSKLTFVTHIKGLQKKCVKALNLLRVVSNTDLGGERSSFNAVLGFVQSKLDLDYF